MGLMRSNSIAEADYEGPGAWVGLGFSFREMGNLWTVQDRRVVSSDFTSKGSSWLLCLEEKGGIRETTAVVEARHDGGLDRVVGDSEGHKK